ncbi:MAG: ABC transporter substrate-binding protein [Fibrobacter sp.]|nr:ABC transporter substrate-binding protein [Fibrobacter sp.]
MRRILFLSCFLLLTSLFCTACSEDSSTGKSGSETIPLKKVKVAMILPRDEVNAKRYDRLVNWFDENLSKTRQVMQTLVDSAFAFEYEWYDENTVNIDSVSRALAKREDIFAIVGPRKSSNVDIAASNCARTGKTLFAPTATSAEIIRKYAHKKWFWALSETDITQSELLIAQAQAYGAKKISLLSSDGIIGKTFVDWFAFQAKELGVEIGKIHTYNGAENLETTAKAAMDDESDIVIVAPEKKEDVEVILQARQKSRNKPILQFSDVAFAPAILTYEGSEGIEGTSMYADPESGFQIAYEVQFGEVPVNSEAQVYDALLILAFAETDILNGNASDLDEAITHVVADSAKSEYIAWDYEGMSRAMAGIASGDYYNIRGASGKLNFDSENGSVVTQSIYCHWMIYEGKFLPLEYISATGSNRTSATLASWNWNATKMQKFNEGGKFTYPEHKSNYALLVAASKTWENYRHQADILNVYQILKYLGYDDDHIVLIMEDDLAENPQNPHMGEVRRHDGQNLYVDVNVDYKLKDLESGDIVKILMGQKSSRLKHVIDADSSTDVLVYWSGHGAPNFLAWGEKSAFTYNQMETALKELHESAKYRKMLWLIEACFSASVCAAAEDSEIPGVMCITAANENETSKADVYNNDYGIYMTNRFTEILTGLLSEVVAKKQAGETPDMLFSDIYYYLFKYTLGSHVTVVNANNFDNLYTAGIREFIVPIN